MLYFKYFGLKQDFWKTFFTLLTRTKTFIRYAREKDREKRERETPSETHSDDGNLQREREERENITR